MGPEQNLVINLRSKTQAPLDAKLIFITLAALQDLGASDVNAYEYYEGMPVYCIETGLRYRWREVSNDESGVLVSNFTYPVGWSAYGIDYGNRNFNFIPESSQQFVPHGKLDVRKADGNSDLTALETGDYVVNSMLNDGTLLLYGRYSGSGDGLSYGDYDSGFRSRFNPV